MIELERQRYLVLEGGRKSTIAIDDNAFNLLAGYHWPGNIRQLRTVIRVALAVCAGSTITLAVLPEEVKAPTETGVPLAESVVPKAVASIYDEAPLTQIGRVALLTIGSF
jgi:transcriptional regulator of acetoin/glycerol metabolism